MAGPFAPVLSEPGQANINPVQTQLPRGAPPSSSLLTDVAGAVATGVDLFEKYKKEEDSRRIDAEIEALEQANVDRLIDGNIAAAAPEDGDDGVDEALPTEAQGELERLQRLRIAVRQGVVSQDKFLLEMVSGVRKIKAMFPTHLAAIDARMVKKLGFRPSTAIIERALAPEKANEARVKAAADTAFKTGAIAQNPVTGEIGPFKNADGTVNHARTIEIGNGIIFAANEAAALQQAAQAKAAALAFQRAEADFAGDARKAAAELDVDMASKSKQGFDNAVDALIGPQMEATLQLLERIGTEATPEQQEQAMQNVAGTIRQTLDGLRKEYNWAVMNQKTRDDTMGYINERITRLMDPFVNKDYGTMLQGARMLAQKKAWAGLTLARNPKLFAFTEMGAFGAEVVKTLQTLDPDLMAGILADARQFGEDLDAQDVASLQRKMISDPNALETMTPSEAKISLRIARKASDAWARDRSKVMDEKSAEGYFNTQHNLAKGAATLPTSKDKREAASFFSDQAHMDRVKELEKLDPEMAQVLGTDAIFVVNESISATGRELANRPGFADTWTVEFDTSIGSFTARMLKDIPALEVGAGEAVPLGGPDVAIGLHITTEKLRAEQVAQMDEAVSIMIDMNAGLRAVEAYQHLDSSLATLSPSQAREAVAASSFLSNAQGSPSTFKNADQRAEVQVALENRFESIGDALAGNLRGLQRSRSAQNKAALIAMQRGSTAGKEKVIRRRYDVETGTFKPME